ncbi:MAG: fatty acid desaturase [Planctomycetota bacterium]
MHVAMEWGLISGGIALIRLWDHPAATVLGALWIGARQHALLALAHEAAHGRLLRPWLRSASRDASTLRRSIVELMEEALTAWPLLASARSYRRVHMAHHRHLGTPRDPDWARNRPDRWGEPAPAASRIRHLLGLQASQRGLLAMFVGGAASSSSAARQADLQWMLARVAFYVGAALVITQLRAWPLAFEYWFLPLLLWTTVLMRLRGISEHWAIPTIRHGIETRTLLLSPLGRLLFLPKNMGYHLEHHLYPGVPFQRLPELHRALQAVPGHAERAHTTRGIPALVAEVASFRRAAPSVQEDA